MADPAKKARGSALCGHYPVATDAAQEQVWAIARGVARRGEQGAPVNPKRFREGHLTQVSREDL